MRKAALWTLIFALMFLAGCQPTPEEEVVIHRDNFESLVNNTPESTIEKIETSNNQTKTHITWQESEQRVISYELEGDITQTTRITVDALVDLSKKSAPVYIVAPQEYDIEFAKKTADYFFSDGYYDGTRTKDDIMIQIIPLQNALPNIAAVQAADTILTILKEDYNEAPENNIEASLEFNGGYNDIVWLKGYPYQGAISEMLVQNGGMSNMLFYYYVDDIEKGNGETVYEYTGLPAVGMAMSQDDARKLAEDAVHNVYGDDMELVQTTLGRKYTLDENWAPAGGGVDFGNNFDAVYEQCYIYYFTRTYNSISQLYAPEASNDDDAQMESGESLYEQKWDYEYSMKWPAEYVMVYVDDTGIVEFWGFSPTAKVELVNDNVEMLSFNEIFTIFRTSIKYTSSWAPYLTVELDINITDINFGMIRVPKKDDPDIFYMVPAWQFIGEKETRASKIAGGGIKRESGKTFLVLNALDGSIIDTSYFENKRGTVLKSIGNQNQAND